MARIAFFTTVFAIALSGVWLMHDLIWRVGYSRSRLVFLFVFSVLFFLLSLGFCHAWYGFIRRLFYCRSRIVNFSQSHSESDKLPKTALVFPVYNEDVQRVFAGVRAVYLDLQSRNKGDSVELFVLSDSTQPDNWIREETAWVSLCRELKASGRIFYRRRELNLNKKSGNLADFCRKWGGRYTYMIVMDADSLMSGDAIFSLIRLMEANPKAGLIQTAPRIINGQSVFARVQQFANRIYGPIFQAGLDFWQGASGNYWGHNAIIRMEPFVGYCDLPDLPGKEPFGGKILSHDFVEAALMVKAGWEVWLAYDIDETYEEGPPSLIDHAKRDRRWLQGNLQHNWLLFSKGLCVWNRIHLFMGIMGYLVSPLWLLFLMLGTWIVWEQRQSGLSMMEVQGAVGRYLDLSINHHALMIFLLSLGMILLAKFLTILDLLRYPSRLRRFGGIYSVLKGMLTETLFSTLFAPLFMLFHSKFILWMLLGRSVVWASQTRETVGTTMREAMDSHLGHTLLGVCWVVLGWWIGSIGSVRSDLSLVIWMSPVLLGMLMSAPISVTTSLPSIGMWLRKHHVLLTPEETEPSEVLQRLEDSLKLIQHPLPFQSKLEKHQGITAAIVDPYVNAIHISLLPGNETSSSLSVNPESLDRLLSLGPDSLSREECFSILKDGESLLALHRRIWTQSKNEQHSWWTTAINEYQRV